MFRILPLSLATAAAAVALLPGGASAAICSGCDDDGGGGPDPVPVTTITSGPSGYTADSTPTFTFSSSVTPATFECKLDGATAWSACSSPRSYALGQGPHTFRVRATASNGTDPVPPSQSFTVDTVAPKLAFTGGPAGGARTNDPTPAYSFGATDVNLSKTQCSVDSQGWKGCLGTYEPAALTDGPHTVWLKAIDLAGNATTVSRPIVVDTIAPVVTVDDVPATTDDPTPAFAFAAPYDGNGAYAFSCALDGGAKQPCSGGASSGVFTAPVLPDGSHVFSVTATDAAGNVSVPADVTQVVDTTVDAPPTPVVTPAPTASPAPIAATPAPAPAATTAAVTTTAKPAVKKHRRRHHRRHRRHHHRRHHHRRR